MLKRGLLVVLAFVAVGAAVWWMSSGERTRRSSPASLARTPAKAAEPAALIAEPALPEAEIAEAPDSVEEVRTIARERAGPPPPSLSTSSAAGRDFLVAELPRTRPSVIDVWVQDQSKEPASNLNIQLYQLTEQQADRVEEEGWSDEMRRTSILVAQEPTDDRGKVKFENVATGWWFVCIDPDEFGRDNRLFPTDRTGSAINIMATTQDSTTLLRVHRKPDASAARDYLVGTVVDESGNPIEAAWIVVEGEENSAPAGWSVSDGSFAIGPVSEGDYWVRAVGEDTRSGDFLDSERASTRPGEPVRLEMPPGFSLNGRVIGAASEVTLFVTQGNTGNSKRTREDGSFKIRALRPGVCSIRAFEDPEKFGEVTDIDIASTLGEEVQISLVRAATLRIHPLRAKTAVNLGVVSGTQVVRWISDIRGSSNRIAVPPGSLKLIASDQSGVQRVRNLFASAGEEYEVEIDFGDE